MLVDGGGGVGGGIAGYVCKDITKYGAGMSVTSRVASLVNRSFSSRMPWLATFCSRAPWTLLGLSSEKLGDTATGGN